MTPTFELSPLSPERAQARRISGTVAGTTGVAVIACVAVGRLLTRRRAEEPDAATGLNDRGRQLIGKVFRLETTMAGGEGRVRVGDSSWRIVGPELLAGTEVKVVRVEGSTLVVEKA